jgi:hypothetical protein
MRVDLPDGGWAELRDPESITNRDRFEWRRRHLPKLIDKIAAENGVAPTLVGEVEVSTRAAEFVMDRMLLAWSFALPLPAKDPEVWFEIPPDVYDAIRDACSPIVTALQGVSFDPKKGEDGPERQSPTETVSA